MEKPSVAGFHPPELQIRSDQPNPLFQDPAQTPLLALPRNVAAFSGRRNPLWSPGVATPSSPEHMQERPSPGTAPLGVVFRLFPDRSDWCKQNVLP